MQKFFIVLTFFLLIFSIRENKIGNICRQSPINIMPSGIINKNKKIINFNYKGKDIFSIKHALMNNNYHFNVINPENYIVNFNNSKYKLIQYHFHKPSEHNLNGKIFNMEVHLVHKSLIDDHYLVVAYFILFDKSIKIKNIFDDSINLKNRPALNLNKELDGKFYYYNGSLTTFPYSANVTWIVFDNKIKTNIPSEEINILWKNMGKSRKIKSNFCKSEILTFDR